MISTEIWSTKSNDIGFLIVPNPLALRPNGSLKLTPSIEKSLYLLFAPITEICVSLLEALLIETLGSSFAKSATDLFIVGTASISSLDKTVPVPTLKAADPASAETTTSSVADLLSVMLTCPDLANCKYKPSNSSVS